MSLSRPYTDRLAWGGLSEGSWTALGTVPQGYRWVVRDVVLDNGFGATATIQLLVVRSQAASISLLHVDVAASRTFHLDLRQTMYATERLDGFATGGGCSVTVTGYLFRDDVERAGVLPS